MVLLSSLYQSFQFRFVPHYWHSHSKTAFRLIVKCSSGKRRTKVWWNSTLFTRNGRGKNIIKLVIAVEKGRDLLLSQVGLFGWLVWDLACQGFFFGKVTSVHFLKAAYQSSSVICSILPASSLSSASWNSCSWVGAPIWSTDCDCHPPQTITCHFVTAAAGNCAWHGYVLCSLSPRAQVRKVRDGKQ